MSTLPFTVVFDASVYPSGRIRSLFVVGLYNITKPAVFKSLHAYDTHESERVLLDSFVALFRPSYRMAGWDTRKTLADSVLKRCFVHGVPFGWYYQDRYGPRYRYNDQQNLDLYDFFTEHGRYKDVVMGQEDVLQTLGVSVPDLDEDNRKVFMVLTAALLVCRVDRMRDVLSVENHNIVVQYLMQTLADVVEYRPAYAAFDAAVQSATCPAFIV